jgi:hypothetical protein
MRKHAAPAEILSGSGSDVLQLAERIALTHHSGGTEAAIPGT